MRTIAAVRLALASGLLASCLAGGVMATTYSVYLEDFTGNPHTEDIAYVRMYVHMDDSGPLAVYACGMGTACQHWFAGSSFGFRNGPSVWLPVHDPAVNTGGTSVLYPLQDGLLVWVDCSTYGTGVSQVTFWRLDDVGDFEQNEYPFLVSISEEVEGHITFQASMVPAAETSWGGVKALYR